MSNEFAEILLPLTSDHFDGMQIDGTFIAEDLEILLEPGRMVYRLFVNFR